MSNARVPPMKIATYNVNGINGRLPRLLEWLEESQPDNACLQEINTSGETFPLEAIAGAGRTVAPAARGRRRHAQPLHRGRGRRRDRRIALPAQRQSAAGPEVRLQA